MGPSRRETHFVWGLQRQKGFDRVWFTDEVDRGPELTLLASSIALSLSLSLFLLPSRLRCRPYTGAQQAKIKMIAKCSIEIA